MSVVVTLAFAQDGQVFVSNHTAAAERESGETEPVSVASALASLPQLIAHASRAFKRDAILVGVTICNYSSPISPTVLVSRLHSNGKAG